MATIPELNPTAARAAGRTVAPLCLTIVRELTEADLAQIPHVAPVTIPPIKQARAVHHRQAQLIAEGKTQSEVAFIVGSTPSRVASLCVDPTFRELIAYYKSQTAEIERETYQRVQRSMVDILELATYELQERLEDDAARAKIPTEKLLKVAEFAADRTIAPTRAVQQGSVAPPAKIELNFAFNKPPRAEPTAVEAEMKVIDHEAQK